MVLKSTKQRKGIGISSLGTWDTVLAGPVGISGENAYQTQRTACAMALGMESARSEELIWPQDGEQKSYNSRGLVGPDKKFGFYYKRDRSPFVGFSAGEITWFKLWGTYCRAQGTLLSALWWPKWEGNPKKRVCIYIYIYMYTYGWFILLHSRN